jgi:tRNA(Arg) A34 adenosine deaminase TadA
MQYTSPYNLAQQLHFMQRAVALSKLGSMGGKGGPFGCVIVKNGEIVGEGYNQVTSTNDPTAHAEVVAIRNACSNLKTFQLHDCEIYTSCEPCPMCLGAIYWARPSAVFYGNSRKDAANIGFDDDFIYQEFLVPNSLRKIPLSQLGHNIAIEAFRDWENLEDKKKY